MESTVCKVFYRSALAVRDSNEHKEIQMSDEQMQILLRAAVICRELGHEGLSDELYTTLGLTTEDALGQPEPEAEDDEWEPWRWWRVTAPDGTLWCETSDEQEARSSVRPGDTLERLWRRVEEEWRLESGDVRR